MTLARVMAAPLRAEAAMTLARVMAASARRGAARAAQLARAELLRPPPASWNLPGTQLASPPALEPVAGRHAFFLPANVKVPPRQPLLPFACRPFSNSSPNPAPAPQHSKARGPPSQLKAVATGLSAVPLLPLSLGLAGAIPFVATAPPLPSLLPLPALLAADPAVAQAAYGACILAFLGAPHWGLAIANYPTGLTVSVSLASATSQGTVSAARYLWGVTPSLLAWVALLLPLEQRFLVLIPSFLLALGVDLGAVRAGFAPTWYTPLRLTLTTVGVLSMSATALTLSVTKASMEDQGPDATPANVEVTA